MGGFPNTDGYWVVLAEIQIPEGRYCSVFSSFRLKQ